MAPTGDGRTGGDRLTIRDVARDAGVSVATVSRVLAGTRPVGAETARTVREAAARLGYRPNQVARALRSRSTGTVGLVLPQITNPFFPSLVRELEHALHAEGHACPAPQVETIAMTHDQSVAKSELRADIVGFYAQMKTPDQHGIGLQLAALKSGTSGN